MPSVTTVGSRSDQRVPHAHLPHAVWHRDPHQSAAVSLSLPAPQDDHLPAAERPADRLGRPRAAVHGNEVGLARILWPDRPGAQGLSAGRRHAQRHHRPEPYPHSRPRCEDELGEEQWAFVEGCPADWGRLPIPDGPITVASMVDMCAIGTRRRVTSKSSSARASWPFAERMRRPLQQVLWVCPDMGYEAQAAPV